MSSLPTGTTHHRVTPCRAWLRDLAAGGRPDALAVESAAEERRADGESANERAVRERTRRTERDLARRRVAASLGRSTVAAVTDETGDTYWCAPEGTRSDISAADVESWPWVDAQTGESWDPRWSGQEAELAARREPKGRLAVVAVRIESADGVTRWVWVDGREIRPDWLADPQKESLAVARCGAAWRVGRMAVSGTFRASPMGCKRPLCPECVASDAARHVAELVPLVACLVALGHAVAHITLTQPAFTTRPDGSVRPVALTAHEQARGYHADQVSDEAWAVGGETLQEAHDRLYASWRELRNGTRGGHRRAWNRYVLGTIYGWEATGEIRGLPRWHAHIHSLVVLRKGVKLDTWWEVQCDSSRARYETQEEAGAAAVRFGPGEGRKAVRRAGGGWWDDLVERWCQLAAASPAAQCCTPVDGDAGSVEDTLKEVIKYPCKLAALTDAQTVEWLAAEKGRAKRYSGGIFHSTSKLGKLVKVLRESVQAGELDTVEQVELQVEELPEDDAAAVRALADAHLEVENQDTLEQLYVVHQDQGVGAVAPEGAHLVELVEDPDAPGGPPAVVYWRPLYASDVASRVLEDGPDAHLIVAVRDPARPGAVVRASISAGVVLADIARPPWEARGTG